MALTVVAVAVVVAVFARVSALSAMTTIRKYLECRCHSNCYEKFSYAAWAFVDFVCMQKYRVAKHFKIFKFNLLFSIFLSDFPYFLHIAYSNLPHSSQQC